MKNLNIPFSLFLKMSPVKMQHFLSGYLLSTYISTMRMFEKRQQVLEDSSARILGVRIRRKWSQLEESHSVREGSDRHSSGRDRDSRTRVR